MWCFNFILFTLWHLTPPRKKVEQNLVKSALLLGRPGYCSDCAIRAIARFSLTDIHDRKIRFNTIYKLQTHIVTSSEEQAPSYMLNYFFEKKSSEVARLTVFYYYYYCPAIMININLSTLSVLKTINFMYNIEFCFIIPFNF